MQRRRDRPRVCGQIEAFHGKTAGNVDLPYPLERQLVHEFIQRLTPIHAVAIHVVQVEQDSAVSRLDYARHELAVRQFVLARSEVTHSRLHCDWNRQSRLQPPDSASSRLDSGVRLARRQEKARCKLARLIEAEVIACPGRAETINRMTEQVQFGRIRRYCPSDGASHAVNNLATRKCVDVIEESVVLFERMPRIGRFYPAGLRLDLEEIKKLGMALD